MDLFRREVIEHSARRLSGEVVLASPFSAKLLTLGLVAVVSGVAVFACTATYARKETAQGWIVPEGGLVRVSGHDRGVLEHVAAHEGGAVLAGESLASLRVSTSLASGNAGSAIATGLADEGLADTASSLASARQLSVQNAELAARRSALAAELSEAESRVGLLRSRAALAKANVDRSETLRQRGYASLNSLETARANALAVEEEASSLRGAILGYRRQITDLDHELLAIPVQRAALRAQADRERATLAQRKVSASIQDLINITAPVDGRIVAVPVSRGQTVAPDTTVVVLVPTGSKLVAELFLSSRAAGFVELGQDVRLMYRAFPYQMFGTGHGVVSSISRTALPPTELPTAGLSVSEPVFRVRVVLDRETVDAYGRKAQLQPGMLLSADLVVDRRSLFEWLLDPLYAAGRRA